jgi:2-furoyl-CoA dehydrogenase large subunit
MLQFGDRIVFGCPPERVVAALGDPATLAAVLPWCSGVEPLAPGRFRATIARRIGPLPMRVEPEVTFQPLPAAGLHRLTLTGGSLLTGRVEAALSMQLRPVPQGTQIDYEGEVQATGLAGRILAERGAEVARRFRAMLNALKARLEGAA